jgi:hypothetical protein
MWMRIVGIFEFSSAELDILRIALEAHAKARLCKEAIAHEGLQVADRFGTLKAHPLLIVEHAARSQFLSAMKMLRLDVPQ